MAGGVESVRWLVSVGGLLEILWRLAIGDFLFYERLFVCQQGKSDSGELASEDDFGSDFGKTFFKLFLVVVVEQCIASCGLGGAEQQPSYF